MSVDEDVSEHPMDFADQSEEKSSRRSRVREAITSVGRTVRRHGSTVLTTIGHHIGRRLEAALTDNTVSVAYADHRLEVNGDERGIVHADALFAGAVEGRDLLLEYDRSHGLTVELLIDDE